jgi:orotate phosphoribosyltransferase
VKAIKAVRELSCEVVLVLALVDRLEGAEAAIRADGIANYQAIFTIRDFGVASPARQGQPVGGAGS